MTGKLSAARVRDFWAKVRKSDGCWEWTGAVDRRATSQPYGRFQLWGSVRIAHRVAWLIEHGSVPDELAVCHRCDNPKCVRIDHLFLGTTQENTADKVAKGRQATGDRITRNRRTAVGDRHGSVRHPEALARGDRHGARLHPDKWKKGGQRRSGEAAYNARLTWDQVDEIRRLRNIGLTLAAIGERFGIGFQHVSDIVRGKIWRRAESER